MLKYFIEFEFLPVVQPKELIKESCVWTATLKFSLTKSKIFDLFAITLWTIFEHLLL